MKSTLVSSSNEGVRNAAPRNPEPIVQADDLRGQISPLSLFLVRPILLIVFALVGGLVGFGVTQSDGYEATAVVEFNMDGGVDDTVVEHTGQTLARQMTSAAVLDSVSTGTSTPVSTLEADVTATWQDQTQLVNVVAKSTTSEGAVNLANTVVDTYIENLTASVRSRLDSARTQSNDVLRQQRLVDAEAERSRQAQLGSAAGDRQDEILAQAMSVNVVSQATDAAATGFSRAIGAAVGLVVGLALGALVALALGVRFMRVLSGRTVRQLLPETEVVAVTRTPDIVGRVVEAEIDCVAVVITTAAEEQGAAVVDDVVELLRAHGRSVTRADFTTADARPEPGILGRSARAEHLLSTGSDTMVAVVAAGSRPARLLQGQSDIASVVVMRRIRTPVAEVVDTVTSFRKSAPTVVLAR